MSKYQPRDHANVTIELIPTELTVFLKTPISVQIMEEDKITAGDEVMHIAKGGLMHNPDSMGQSFPVSNPSLARLGASMTYAEFSALIKDMYKHLAVLRDAEEAAYNAGQSDVPEDYIEGDVGD